MLTSKMQDALNKQLNEELYSANMYLALSAYYDAIALDGFASWMRAQAQEELGHAMQFFKYINDRTGRVLMQAVKAPPTEWESPQAAFAAALEHERFISQCIYTLVETARGEKDHATEIFLQAFVTEQTEEEATFDAIVSKLDMIGDHKQGLFMMDRELASRRGVMGLEAPSGNSGR